MNDTVYLLPSRGHRLRDLGDPVGRLGFDVYGRELAPPFARLGFADLIAAVRARQGRLTPLETSLLFLDEWKRQYSGQPNRATS